METITLVNGYDRNKTKETLTFRNPVDVAEMIQHCSTHSHIWFIANDGKARQCKVNGAVKTWKRRPNQCRVPVKYGMYEYGAFYECDIQRILIPVK